MNKLLRSAAQVLLCPAIAASLLPWTQAAQALPPAQAQPRIFTLACAAPPRCVQHLCLRMGRCSIGSHTQGMGCLLYACRGGTH